MATTNLQVLADQILVSICVVATFVAFRWVIPRMTQMLSLYLLHNIRERIFEFTVNVPGALEARRIRLAESLIAWCTHVVRDRPFPAAVGCALALTPDEESKELSPKRAKMVQEHLDEMAAIFSGKEEAWAAIEQQMRLLPVVVYIRVAGGNPVLFFGGWVLALCMLFAALWRLIKRPFLPADHPTKTPFPTTPKNEEVLRPARYAKTTNNFARLLKYVAIPYGKRYCWERKPAVSNRHALRARA